MLNVVFIIVKQNSATEYCERYLPCYVSEVSNRPRIINDLACNEKVYYD